MEEGQRGGGEDKEKVKGGGKKRKGRKGSRGIWVSRLGGAGSEGSAVLENSSMRLQEQHGLSDPGGRVRAGLQVDAMASADVCVRGVPVQTVVGIALPQHGW